MEEAMSTDNGRSPAAKVMDEAIDLAIEGRSPYPERAAFIDATRHRPVMRSSVLPTKGCQLFSLPPTAAPRS
jgi:hypothetical protein